MKQLKKILQSKKILIFLTIITLISILYFNLKPTKSKYNGNETNFIGEILKYKKLDNTYMITLLSKEDEKLIVYLDNFTYDLGDKIYLEGSLELPNNNTVLNNFNYKEYLKREKITYILKAKNSILISKNKNILYDIKNKLLKYMSTFKSENYLKSFILGDTSYLDANLYKSFQINGICHILSIGSTHITFLSIILLTIFKKLKIKEHVSYIILILVIFCYLLIVDFNVPILRVYLYIIISFLNRTLKLEFSHLKIFYLDILLTLFLFPNLIYHKGFLYSYIISFLLIMNKNKFQGNYFKKLFKISFISFLGSFPLNIYFNYNINLLSVLYNFLYVPVFGLIVFPLVFLTLLFKFLDNSLYFLMNILVSLSYYLDDFKLLVFIFKKPSIFIVIFYFILIIWFLKRKSKLIFSIFLLSLVIHFNINNLISSNFFMMLDVSQGDSLLINLDKKVILVDTGGLYYKNVCENTITMLYSLGIKKIDYLILTHGDYDHMGDAIYLVNNFNVNKVILNNDNFNNLENALIEVLEKKKIKYYNGLKELTTGNLKISFLNTKIYDNENDNSNVLYFLYNNYKFLLMGDASSNREDDILEKYNLENIDFFKVAHHGSNTSSSKKFIETIKPKHAFISVGLNNSYGHPREIVLKNLENSQIYRTDLDGSCYVKFKKNSYEIITFPP